MLGTSNAPSQLKLIPSALSAVASEGAFRPIHYLGSKLRLANEISRAVDSLTTSQGAVCDLFAGTGTVSQALIRTRPVIAVDVQEYSRVLCEALLNYVPSPDGMHSEFLTRAAEIADGGAVGRALQPLLDFEAEAQDLALLGRVDKFVSLVQEGSLTRFALESHATGDPDLDNALRATLELLRARRMLDDPDSTVSRYFGGIYFSFRQAVELDALLSVANTAPAFHRTRLLASVLGAASDVVSSVGKHFAQPMQLLNKRGEQKQHLIAQAQQDRDLSPLEAAGRWLERYDRLEPQPNKARVNRADYREALAGLRGEVAAVYADPPYTRDHYSRFYHVLETMCLRDNPEVSTVRVRGATRLSRGMYRLERHQSPFSIIGSARHAFSALFDGVRSLDVPLLLSYSPNEAAAGGRARVLGLETIEALAQEHFSEVRFLNVQPHSHNKFNSRELNARVFPDGEVLLACVP